MPYLAKAHFTWNSVKGKPDIDGMSSAEKALYTSLERDELEQDKRNRRFLGLFGRKKKQVAYGSKKPE